VGCFEDQSGGVFSTEGCGGAGVKDDDYMDLNEAVKHIMKATGKTRRQAEAAVKQAAKSGAVRLRGVNTRTGEEEEIPVEVLAQIPSEH
jgi:hypothetical protein